MVSHRNGNGELGLRVNLFQIHPCILLLRPLVKEMAQRFLWLGLPDGFLQLEIGSQEEAVLAALLVFRLVSTGEEAAAGERDVGGALLVLLHGVSSTGARAVLCLAKRESPELPRALSFPSRALCVESWLLLQFPQPPSPMCVPVIPEINIQKK